MSPRHPEPEPEPSVRSTFPAGSSTSSQAGGSPSADPAPGAPVEPAPAATPAESGAPAAQAASTSSDPDAPPARPGKAAPKQTLAGRVWVAIAVAAILLVLLIIFIAENTRRITISFVGLHGHISEALALLIAIVVGIVITLLVGSARIVQLSLEVRRHRRKLKTLGEL